MNTYLLLFLSLCCCAQIKINDATTHTTITNAEVEDFLVNSGYLEPDEHRTRYIYNRALRLFQRENGLVVNGRITHEVREFIRQENDRQYVLDYLKTFGYIRGVITPYKIVEAIQKIQTNSGIAVTGTITQEMVDFLKSRLYSFAEPMHA